MGNQAFWTEAMKWWQGLTNSVQEGVIAAAALVGALVVGKIVGAIVKALSKGFGLDEVFRFPFAHASSSRARKTFSDAIGYLCVASVWAGAIWWLAVRHQLVDIANAVRFALGRLWVLAIILGFAIGLSNWLIRLFIDFTKSQTVKEWTEKFVPQTREHFSDTLTRSLAFLVYAFVLLFALVVATDLFGLREAAGAIRALWDLNLRLIIAAIALGIGWFGVRWVERLREFPELPQTPTNLAQYFARLGIVAASFILVLILLTGGGAVLVGLLLAAAIFLFLLPIREYIPDLWAGVMLRLHNVRKVTIDGREMNLSEIMPLASKLNLDTEELVMSNSQILQAFLGRRRERT